MSRTDRMQSQITGSAALTVILFLNTWAAEALATKLQPSTAGAWDQYLRWVDQRVEHELSDPHAFLVVDFFPSKEKVEVKRQLDEGQIVVRRMPSAVPKGQHFEIHDGEIHHWWGAILVPRITLPKLLAFLQDYDRHAGKFADVERSRLLSRDGNLFRFYFRINRSKSFVTAIYNTEQECVYTARSPTQESSRSIATRIAEVTDPGKPSERENPPGDDRGFLWRLASWWRFQETERGVIVELESASLSRDIPAIVKIIPGVSSYIRSTPRQSIESILSTIRDCAKSIN